MDYIKPPEADTVPQMPEQSCVITNGTTDLFKNKYNKKYGNSASSSPDTSQCRLGSTDTVALQNPTGFSQAKGMKNIYYVMTVYNYECCLYVY